MKKMIMIIGVILLIASVVCLLYAVMNRYVFYHVLDASAEKLDMLHHRMVVSLTVGLVLAAAGAACVVIYTKR
ncbi:MAG: hypothetical protein IK064_05855 [Clostridia bacterium]|nr:hypothetical protein [Clostridia bacterium]